LATDDLYVATTVTATKLHVLCSVNIDNDETCE